MKEMEEGYSDFCREAIIDKAKKEFSEEYLKNKRKELQDSIKKLDQQLKTQKGGSSKIQAILDFGYKSYTTDWLMLEDDAQCEKIQRSLIPKLRDAGCNKYKVIDILRIFRQRRAKEGEIE